MSQMSTNREPLSRAATAGLVAGSFVALLYAIEIVDTATSGRLDQYGVHPRDIGGLDGIVFAPLLHGGWAHLTGNTVPLLVLGFLLALAGVRTWVQVTAIVWIAGGAAVWLLGGENTNHIGASGVVFGWLAYLIVRGVFNRSLPQIVVGIVVFALYGGVLWGVLPGRPGVSWESHLFGAVAGALAAWLLAARRSARGHG
jgi:membrane associated rhomboid family serine protease